MQTNIQTVLLRTSFRVSFLLIGAIIIIANVAIYIHEQRGELKAEFIKASHCITILQKGKSGPDRLQLVLYQACLDPFSENSVPLLSVMPLRVIALTVMNIVNIMCNFYLYMYLEDKRKDSTGMSHKHTAVKNKPLQGMAPLAHKEHSLDSKSV